MSNLWRYRCSGSATRRAPGLPSLSKMSWQGLGTCVVLASAFRPRVAVSRGQTTFEKCRAEEVRQPEALCFQLTFIFHNTTNLECGARGQYLELQATPQI